MLEPDQATVEKTPHRFAGTGQYSPVHDESRRLEREDEIIGRLLVPLAEGRGLLQTVVGAIDLNAAQMSAGKFQFA